MPCQVDAAWFPSEEAFVAWRFVMKRDITSCGGADKDGVKKMGAFMRDYPVKEHVVYMTSELWEYFGKPDRLGGYEVRLDDSLEGWKAVVMTKDLDWMWGKGGAS